MRNCIKLKKEEERIMIIFKGNKIYKIGMGGYWASLMLITNDGMETLGFQMLSWCHTRPGILGLFLIKIYYQLKESDCWRF